MCLPDGLAILSLIILISSGSKWQNVGNDSRQIATVVEKEQRLGTLRPALNNLRATGTSVQGDPRSKAQDSEIESVLPETESRFGSFTSFTEPKWRSEEEHFCQTSY